MNVDASIESVRREHVLTGLRQVSPTSQRAVGPLLIHAGGRYSARQVVAAALGLGGVALKSTALSKSKDSQVVRRLRRCGFTVVPEGEGELPNVVQVLSEILDLQREWQSTNTPAMAKRGALIRTVLPQVIRGHATLIEPEFFRGGYSMEAEGSDGVGRKVESAWARVFDSLMSPSATTGWYVVLHFERTGQAMYATVGCGATKFINGEFVAIPSEQLARQVAWARGVAAKEGFPVEQYSDSIRLHGNALSGQFEEATAFAKRFPRNRLDEGEFWETLRKLSSLLVALYEEERKGRAPLSEAPEVVSATTDIAAVVSGKPRQGRGQGRGLTPEERRAVERRAMLVAEADLRAHGFTDIRDVSLGESFDVSAKRDGIDWCVEVKGTTSATAGVILMTAQEVALHRARRGATVLVLVRGIDLQSSSGSPEAMGGEAETLAPWDCDLWEFEPTAFRAKRVARP